MSHELEVIDGRASFLGREDAWHRLGVVLGRDASWADVQEHVPTITLPVRKVAGTEVLFPTLRVPADVHFTVRDDGQLLAPVGDRYTVIQAREMYDLLPDMPLKTAGVLREGRVYFFTYSLGESVIGGESITHELSVVGSHDGSIANQAIESDTVIVCANTMAMALSGAANKITLRHTSGVFDRIAEAKRTLAMAYKRVDAFRETVEQLQTVTMSMRAFDMKLDALLPVKADQAARTANEVTRARDAIKLAFTEGAFTADFVGTGWAFVQAVNSYEQWSAPVRASRGVSKADARALRQFDAVTRQGQPLTDKARELVLA